MVVRKAKMNLTTEILQTDDEGMRQAGEILKNNELVAFPTETVFGLGANGLSDAACLKIFEAKGRPQDNPLILHVSDADQALTLFQSEPPHFRELVDMFWPGPLTIVYHKSDLVPLTVTAGLDTVAVRCPAHKVALRLIEEAGVPLAAPSANTSGKPSPTHYQAVLDDLNGRISGVVAWTGRCECGLESTIIDLTQTPAHILRPGLITHEELSTVLPVINNASLDPKERPKAPGMKYRHYAPDTTVEIITGTQSIDRSRKCIVLGMESQLDGLINLPVFNLGPTVDDACRNLFGALRCLDSYSFDVAYIFGLPDEGKGVAFMNRLRKAASK
ncbi:hypothetical protein PCE1_000825 [Barthelona sp. PCE]